jgi:hypothetical protein
MINMIAANVIQPTAALLLSLEVLCLSDMLCLAPSRALAPRFAAPTDSNGLSQVEHHPSRVKSSER